MSFPPDFEGTKGIIHPEDKPRVVAALELLQNMGADQLDFRLITTYGEIKTLSGRNIYLDLESESPADDTTNNSWVAATDELAGKKEAALLRLRQALSETAEKQQGSGTWYINKSTGETWFSDGVFRIHGLAPQSLNAHPNTFNSFIHADDRGPVLEAYEQAFIEGIPLHIEYRILQAGGGLRYVRQLTGWSFNELGQQIFSGAVADVTELVELAGAAETAETNVQLHQQLVQFAEREANAGYWFMNLVTRKTVFSPNYQRMHGIKTPYVPSHKTFFDLVHPDDGEKVEALVQTVYSQQLLTETEYRIIRPDGRQRYLRLTGKLYANRGSEPIMMGVVTDVTAIKTLEKNIQELGETISLQNITTEAAEQIAAISSVVFFPNGSMYWSEGFYRLLGYKPRSVEPLLINWQKTVHPEDVKLFGEAIALAQQQQAGDELVFRVLSKAGLRQLRLSFRQVLQDGRSTIVGIVQDITAQKALQQQAAGSERYAALLEDVSQDLLVLTNTENTIISWNTAAEAKTGIRRADALNNNLFDVFPTLRTEAFVAALQQVFAGGEMSVAQTRNAYLSKSHSYQLVPFRDEAGALQGVLHVVRDISREIEMQQQLRERLAFIENLLDATVDRIVVLDRDMNYLYWNPKAEEYYGMSKQRVLAKNILEVFPAFRNDPGYPEFRQALKGETVYLPAHAQGGEYYETYLIPIKDDAGVNAVLWIVHDLGSELKLQQERENSLRILQEQHRRLNEAQSIGKVGSFEWTVGAELTHWSDELYRINGLEPGSEEITLDKVDRFVHPDDDAALQALKKQSLQQPGDYKMTHRIVRRDGQLRWINHEWESIANERGEVVRVTGIVQDITEQQMAEAQLRERTHYLRRIQETVPDMISITELATRKYTYLNSEAFFADGFNTERLNTKSAEELAAILHPEDRQTVAAYFQKLSCASDDEVLTAEYRAKDDAGQWKSFFVRGRVFQRDASGVVTHVLNVIENITERKRSENEIRASRELLKATIDSSLDMIQVFEAVRDESGAIVDFKYTLLNEAAEKWMPDPIGKSLLALQPGVVEEGIFDAFKQVVETGTPQHYEKHYQHEQFDGWFYQSVVKLHDGVATTTTDITSRKIAEQSLEKTTRLLDTIINSSLYTIQYLRAVRDDAGQIIDFEWAMNNKKAIEQNGDVLGKRLLQHNPGVVQSGLFDKFVAVTETGVPTDHEVYYHHEQFNGWFHQMLVKVGDGFVMNTEDITGRKQAEQEVLRLKDLVAQKATDKYYSLFNTMQSGLSILELIYDDAGKPSDLRWVEVNPAFEKIIGLKGVEGRRTSEFVATEQYWLDVYDRVIKTGESIEYENYHADLNQWFRTHTSRVGGPESNTVVNLFEDVTERKKSEAQLQEFTRLLEQQVAERTNELERSRGALEQTVAVLQQAEELAQIGSWEYNSGNAAFTCSEGMYRLLEKTPGEVLHPDVYLKYATDDSKATAEKVVRLIKETQSPFEETLHLQVNGVEKIVRVKANVTGENDGELRKMIGVNLDVTNISTAEEKIRESQNLLRQTTLASPDAITLYDLELRQPVYLNDRLPMWLGYSGQQLAEMSFEQRLQLIHPDDQEALLAFNAGLRIADGNGVQKIDYRLLTGDGTYMWIRNRSRPFTRNQQNKPRYVLSVLQDISQEMELRRQLVERTSYTESLVDSSIDRICVYDRNYAILAWNRRFEELVGVSKEEALGKNFKTLFPRLFENKTLGGAMEQAFSGELVHLPPHKAAYAKGYHERFYIPLKDGQGETYAVMLVVHDVTETVMQQMALKELNQTLEKQNRDLEAKNEEIISFAFVASHDLKEPVRKLHNFTDLMAQKEGANLSKEGKDLLQRMDASVRQLDILLADILELTRIGADNKGFAQTDLNKMVAKTLADLHEEVARSGATVLYSGLPTIRVIEKQVFYLFKNLLINAIKFQEPGNQPVIKISATEVAGTEVPGGDAGKAYQCIAVADNGIGFELQYKKKIFQMFRRLHNRQAYAGTGIGLTICRRVMDNHQGFIDVATEPGKGATFYCYFPV
ncbi:PAS domain S-box protein [Paracnuella aquatica]|uniref:PAS domain S-box protein n=1 Tax=Paracnuella aquatica TaxID=2268757 RepID=UPI000F507233|nr:PAS domain S-box protein [Paracnuella aquatica]RPD47559.1 PAS domain S-box protein [Paracnuella aquatica]